MFFFNKFVFFNIYPNFFIDENPNFILNRLFATRYLINTPAIFIDDEPFNNHVRFFTNLNLEYGRHNVLRYVNRSVLQGTLDLVNTIKQNHVEFYNQFKETFQTLVRVCERLIRVIGNNTIDLELIDGAFLNSGDIITQELNYGLLLLNDFKILIDTLIGL